MKNKKKGFTLMELLIVVAIIAVLVAIMIPTMGTQLEKAREATDAANIRAALAEVTIAYLNGSTTAADYSETIVTKQTKANWQMSNDAPQIDIGGYSASANTSGSYTVTCDSSTGEITIS